MSQPSIQVLFDLTGQSAVVTGGAKGIGEAIVRRLCEAGARVLIADLDEGAGETLAKSLRGLGRNAKFVRFDAANVNDGKKAIDEALAAFGRLDILVNNAGVFPFSPALETNESVWDHVLDINLKGPFFLAQAAARVMRKNNGGTIINIASIDALHPTGALAHYDASKGGLVMLTRSLALELAPFGIRVNTISPGGIATPGAANATASMGVDPAKVSEAFGARIPMKRMGDPDEIARAALFLATPAASYVTGANLVVDGGYLLT